GREVIGKLVIATYISVPPGRIASIDDECGLIKDVVCNQRGTPIVRAEVAHELATEEGVVYKRRWRIDQRGDGSLDPLEKGISNEHTWPSGLHLPAVKFTIPQIEGTIGHFSSQDLKVVQSEH